MSYCINPDCQHPQNPSEAKYCQTCGWRLQLKDRYRAIQLIGQGGFGRTYLAVDEHKPSKPRCVIKQFHPQTKGENYFKKAAELFEQEAIRLDSLGKHPQIPELYAHFDQDDNQYLVQAFVEGYNLAQILRNEGAFNEIRIRNLLQQVLPILDFIHEHHIIHRDIKPENLICSPNGQLVLVDFGAAKYATGTALLKTGTTIGSPEYIAPEQARGRAVFASDLYSLGTTCLHLITAMSPFDLFDSGEAVWVWSQYLVDNQITPQLQRILDRLVETAVNKRYQTASEAIADLAQPLSYTGAMIPPPPPPPSRRIPKPRPVPPPPVFRPGWQCTQTLTGHANSVGAIALTRDGQYLATGSFDCTIKLWRLDGGAVSTLNGHYQPVTALIFTPDGQTLISASVDDTVKLWNWQERSLVRSLTEHSGSVVSVSLAVSADGQQLAIGSDNHRIKLVNLTNSEIISLQHSRGIHSVAFSPDGQYLVSGSSDNTVQLWDVTTQTLIAVWTGHLRDVNAVAFHPSGELVASASSDKTLRLWSAKDGKLVRTLKGHRDWVRTVAFSPDGKLLASGSADKTIRLWDSQTGEVIETLEGHEKDVNTLLFTPDGERLVSGSSDKTIKIWQNQQTPSQTRIQSNSGITMLPVLLGYSELELTHTLYGHSDSVYVVAFHPNGQLVASGSWDGTIKLWKVANGQQFQTLKGHLNRVYTVAFHPEGQLMVSGSWDGTLRFWHVGTGKLKRTLREWSGKVRSVAVSPDGEYLASSAGKQVKLWDFSGGTEVFTLSGHLKDVNAIAWSPDGKMLATASADGTIKLWDMSSYQEFCTLQSHQKEVSAIAWGTDAEWLVSGSLDQTIKLWHIPTQQMRHTLVGHTGGVLSVAFCTDGQTLVSGSVDRTIKLWDIYTQQEQYTLKGHSSYVWSVALHPSCDYLASSGGEGTIKLWRSR
ncbi:protein kinase [Desertifilum sp. FACHB-1129]|uniref:Protein kinase domain-containing protein n=1 Tax=Desertifilum tharense IPPAS B-1220 TaxID=1781255 RepID=A0A1E5QP23_9CYAN|nr:protein kinase [Desertifilum tharense]MBD2312407.1 protein kinase [Desertifilum sp. FACHB-1129]MBD2321190.1 protein kinase [Desertifilum sp. FACHB-866]MBD2331503.1 protein kinase [Desertifilum sp. FACHB-868]OEJ76093.1 hypothetical protein BH720_05910 [Desertifilum tharense IPPAS B-1220]